MKIKHLIIAAVAVLLCLTTAHSQGKSTYAKSPEDFNLPYDSLNIKTSDGMRLTGWFIKSEKPDSTYTVFMTSGANMSHFLPFANFVRNSLGMNVVLFDRRGMGTSDAAPLDESALARPEFLTDINGSIDWSKRNLRIDTTKLILYGFSMGASLSICAASGREDIYLLVADSPYADQKETVTYLNSHFDKKLTYIDDARIDPIKAIEKVTCKTLFLANVGDVNVPYENSIRLFEKAPTKLKEIWITPHEGHGDAVPLNPTAFRDILEVLMRKG